MTFQSLDTSSPSRSVEVLPGAAILRRGAAAMRSTLQRYWLLIGFLAFWQIGSSLGWINPTVFPPLDKIIAATWTGVVGGALLDDIAISLERSGLAFAAAVGLVIPLGLFMRKSGRWSKHWTRSCSSSARPRHWRYTRCSSCLA